MSISSDLITGPPSPQQLTRTARNRLRWKGIISEWKDSGLTPLAFCKSRGLDKAQFSYYQKSLTKKNLQPSKIMPIEVSTQESDDHNVPDEPLTLYLSAHAKPPLTHLV